ncbi:MAG: drug/metabolite exporter YedA [bacterium]|nr:drug/metabolite exporter YedA [bacterium]
MSVNSNTKPTNDAVILVAALFAVYVIWGSTYLAIRVAVEDGFAPLTMSAIRFLVAGGLMYGWLRVRGGQAPSRQQWINAIMIGALMMVGGVGLVTVAEDAGIGSGVAATAIAAVPLWAAVWSRLFGEGTTVREAAGIAVGFVGVAILATAGDLAVSALGAVLILISPVLWALGSVWSKRLDLPDGAMATATEMLTGGVLLAVLAPVFGERFDGSPQLASWLALGYLILFGSMIAFSAYMYLLRNVRPALATSYAYVNPAVAVLLGVSLGNETVSFRSVLALPIILVGVGLIAQGRRLPLRQR